MVPYDKKVHILCSSHDKGGAVRKYCQVGCIGCQRCVKEAPEGAIVMEENLAVVDYEAEIPAAVAETCPMNTIQVAGAPDTARAAGGEG
jgi:ferredoxin